MGSLGRGAVQEGLKSARAGEGSRKDNLLQFYGSGKGNW